MIEFVLRSDLDGSVLVFPSNPEDLGVTSNGSFVEVTIDDLGSAPEASGRDPTKYSWSGVLYGAGHAMLPIIHQWRPPIDITAQMDNWVDQQYQTKRPLTLVVTDTPVNKQVWISQWEYHVFGGFGDYKYSVEFTEARGVFVQIEGESAGTVGGDVAATGDDQPQGGEEAPTPSTYTVQSGDYLTLISQQLYGTTAKWRDLYDANKDAIGPDPDLIQPGTVLNVPGGSTTESDVEVTTDDLGTNDTLTAAQLRLGGL